MWEFLKKPIEIIEEQIEMILDGLSILFFWAGAVFVFPGFFWWGEIYGIGCFGMYWELCDNGVGGILYAGMSDALFFFVAAFSITFSKLILVRLGHRTEKD